MARNDKRPLLLFAEDDHEDWLLIEDALQPYQNKCDVERVLDGEALLNRLRDTSKPHPSLIMLDFRMPRMDGFQALAEIRADPQIAHIPVIMMTASKTEIDIYRAYKGGANSYLVKPMSFEAMQELQKRMYVYWMQTAELPVPRAAIPR